MKEKKYFKKNKVNILSLSWRDIMAPKSGGAEVQTHGMLHHLDSQKYNVIHLSPMYPGAKCDEIIDGIRYIRWGNSITVIFFALFFYIKYGKKIQYVIDECNTHRFFTPLYIPKRKRIFLIYQLTREIWHINVKFPLDYLGYFFENWMLKLYKNTCTITESLSTKKDLISLGFQSENIKIIHIGINDKIAEISKQKIRKEANPTFIYVGRYSAYKGIEICIQAFAIVRKKIPNAKLWIVGKKDRSFIDDKIIPICSINNLSVAEGSAGSDIVLWGFVDEQKKYELMQKSWLLLFPSLREGWGIIVTEAARLGTPSLVSNTPGCIDAVDYGRTGYICEERSVEAFADKMLEILDNTEEYKKMQIEVMENAKSFEWKSVSMDVNIFFDNL